MDTNILLLDAPSGAGKTRYIKKLGANSTNTLTSEQLKEAILQMSLRNISPEALAAQLDSILFLENLEDLAGKENTQRCAAQLIRHMASRRKGQPLILTGIHLETRLPVFLKALGTYKPLHL